MKSYNEAILKKDIPKDQTIKVVEHSIYGHFPLHRHEYYEIEYICSGSGSVTINGTVHKYNAGSVWISTPTDFHEILSNGKSTIINISFRLDWIENELINSLPYGTIIQSYDEKIFSRFLKEYESGRYCADIYLKHSLSCILVDFIRIIDAQETNSTFEQFSHPIGQAIRYIQSHFSDNITLNDVASEVGLSPTYFSTRFHNEVKLQFQAYLVKARIENAAKFLSSTQNPIIDICYLSGFKNYANFTKAFKKHYSMTPVQYRKENYLKLSV